MAEPAALALAIAALNAQRVQLGDAAVDAAIAALRAGQRTNVGTRTDPHPEVPDNTQLGPAAPPLQRLRQVSVVFVDVVESTGLLSQVGVEDAPAVVDAAVRRFAELVQAHGGRVLRFTGDGLKAAFGAEQAFEDAAEQAVRAGLAVLQAAAEHAQGLQQRLGVKGFAVRVGIHTGPVVLGGGAEADRSAIGHAVHLAARLEQSAPPGHLRISHDTWMQVRGLFDADMQPPLAVKGQDTPLTTYLVRGPRAGVERDVQRGIEGLSTPLIGRAAELAHLRRTFDRVQGGEGLFAVTVLAEAGLGKTRLRREFLAHLGHWQAHPNHRHPGLLQARAHRDGQLLPYGLLRQLLARWLSIPDDLDAPSACQRLIDGLLPWLEEPAQPLQGAQGDGHRHHDHAMHRAQALGQLMGFNFSHSDAVQALSPRELSRLALSTLIEVLRRLAQARPLVLVLDDLHWADDASLDFLPQLTSLRTSALMVLMLARPAVLERRPQGLWAVGPAADGASGAAAPAAGAALAAEAPEVLGHTTLTLTALDPEQSPLLAQALLQHLPDAPSALVALLLQRAQGNPFYMEELVRMWIDDGVIDAGRRPWTLRQRWQDHARVPTTLVGVLQARLDALPAHELGALQQASIVGPVFWDSALAALDEQAPHNLPALAARALVVERAHSSFEQTQERAFHHQLLHDVTYGTVMSEARRAGHARAARWLAQRLADREGEFVGLTAEHFEKAGDSAQALEYFDRAREQAQRQYAHSATLAHTERALRQSALTAPMWRYQLLFTRQSTLQALGDFVGARQALADLSAFAEAQDSDAMRADVLAARMLNADREGHAQLARELAQQAVALGERAHAPAAAALGHGELAWLALMRGDHGSVAAHITEGVVWARRAAALSYREGGYPHYELQLRTIEIESLLESARPFAAAQALAQTLLIVPPDKKRDRVNLLTRQARAHADIGELPQSLALAHEAVTLARSLDLPRLQAGALVVLADVAGLQNDRLVQEEAARRAQPLAEATEDAASLAHALSHQAEVARLRGDIPRAEQLWQRARSLFDEQEVHNLALETRAQLAALRADAGEAAAATAAVEQLLARAARIGDGATDGAQADQPQALANPPRYGPTAWPLANPATLVLCAQVLRAATPDPTLAVALVAELRRRMHSLAAQAPDAQARRKLLALPHWQATMALEQVLQQGVEHTLDQPGRHPCDQAAPLHPWREAADTFGSPGLPAADQQPTSGRT